MPINPIQLPQKREKRDALDRIVQGLQIAEGVFKLPVAYEQLMAYQTDREAKERDLATKKRVEELKLTPVELASAKLVPATAEDTNAFDVTVMLPGGKFEPRRVKSQTDLSQLADQVGLMKNLEDLKLAPYRRQGTMLEIQHKQRELETPKTNESAAAGFASRMVRANKILEDLQDQGGFDPTSLRSGIESLLPNVMVRGEAQQFNQAKRDFVTSVLRKESGANITKDELTTANKQYFPQAGDSAEVVEQKRLNRLQAIENLKAEAGPMAMGRIKSAPTPGVPKPKGMISEAQAKPSGAGPKPGQIEDGYRFKGGNPADSKNWEKL